MRVWRNPSSLSLFLPNAEIINSHGRENGIGWSKDRKRLGGGWTKLIKR